MIVKRFIIFLLVMMPGSLLLAQESEQIVVLSGTITDAENQQPLTGVHLVTSRLVGTTTDIDGNFRLSVLHGDTILISHVGYNEYLVPVPKAENNELHLTIVLSPALTELDEIVIYQWPATIAQLKQKILATEVEVQEKLVIPGSYQGPPKPVKPGIGSPISFLQSKLSKKIRRRQEFLKKRVEFERNQHKLSRYNAEFVMEITGIQDKQALKQFMDFCKLTDVFIAEVSDYDLITAINQCYKDFQADQLH